jgi:redox-sensitive bicupin YhaK (pirin superfamily)
MTDTIRPVTRVITPTFVMEGAGVRLQRSIATRTLDYLDPFLLLDHFGSDDPDDYIRGFPTHPHRGIETVTYMLAGAVRHGDSLGNSGVIGAGDVQWMTAGGGIMHEEMPEPRDGKMAGFQLWVNLPAALKMSAPRYQEIKADQIPVLERPGGVRVRLVAGELDGVRGPVTEIAINPGYLDVHMPAAASFEHAVPADHTTFIYLYEGAVQLGAQRATGPQLLVLGDGERIVVETAVDEARFLLVWGRPLHEPIARYGPFVMNTREEIQQALRDLRNGTFVYRP